MKLIKMILFSAVICFGAYSCEKDKGPLIKRPVVPVDPVDTFIHYSLYIQPIFDEFCIRCHNQSHQYLDLSEGKSYDELWTDGTNAPYVDTLNKENSILMQHLEGISLERMPPEPPYPLTSQIDTIRQWMMQGARDN